MVRWCQNVMRCKVSGPERCKGKCRDRKQLKYYMTGQKGSLDVANLTERTCDAKQCGVEFVVVCVNPWTPKKFYALEKTKAYVSYENFCLNTYRRNSFIRIFFYILKQKFIIQIIKTKINLDRCWTDGNRGLIVHIFTDWIFLEYAISHKRYIDWNRDRDFKKLHRTPSCAADPEIWLPYDIPM